MLSLKIPCYMIMVILLFFMDLDLLLVLVCVRVIFQGGLDNAIFDFRVNFYILPLIFFQKKFEN